MSGYANKDGLTRPIATLLEVCISVPTSATKSLPANPLKRFFTFKSVFSKLFASVLLALLLFAVAMLLLTRLFYDTSAHTRHQILASQVTQQLDPLLIDFRKAQDAKQRLESRYLLSLIRRSFNVYAESVNARFGLYDGTTHESIMLMEGMPNTLPDKPNDLLGFFRPEDPKKPTQVQINSQSGYVVLYESNRPNHAPVPPAISFLTGLILLLLIMSAMLWFITRTMTWRINQLSHQITQFGEGNFSVRVTPAGDDEITTLARGFNHTAERIETLMNANKLLLAHASHEIRTPITRMRLQVEMMSLLAEKLDRPVQEKFDKRAEAINRDLTGLNDLVESILLVSRLDAGHALDKMEVVDLFDLIKTEVQHYPKASFVGSHVQIEGQTSLLTHLIRNLLDNAHLHGIPPVMVELYAIDELGHQVDLPIVTGKLAQAEENPVDTPLTILENTPQPTLAHSAFSHINPFTLPATLPNFNTQTFANVSLANKLVTTETDNKEAKASGKDKPKVKAGIFSRKKSDKTTTDAPVYQRIRIAVIDQGTGIALDKREEIFSPFVRLKQEKKGSGLGLSLVSQIVTAHHGTIITDTLDGHTRFLVTLPVEQKIF